MIGSIEMGVSYVTRNGSTVAIEHDNGIAPYPFFGLIISASDPEGRIAYFTYNGSYNIDRETVFDITGPANVRD